jgi:hypothetical protein
MGILPMRISISKAEVEAVLKLEKKQIVGLDPGKVAWSYPLLPSVPRNLPAFIPSI